LVSDGRDNKTSHSSKEYDQQIRRTIPYYDNFHKETINFMDAFNSKPKTWLDTGCGTGIFAEKCLKSFPETTLYLADPSEAMMQIARQKLSCSSNVIYLKPASTINLSEIIPCKLDVITAIQAHHYMPVSDKFKTFKVCFDLLDPDGVFINFENVLPVTPQGTELAKRNWSNYQLSMGKTEGEVEDHLARLGNRYFPITIE